MAQVRLYLRKEHLFSFGPMNWAFIVLGLSCLPLSVLFLVFAKQDELCYSAVTLSVGIILLLQNFHMLSAVASIVRKNPFVTFSSNGIAINGGLFDRWDIQWSEIEIFTPDLDTLDKRLRGASFKSSIIPSGFLDFSIKVPKIKKGRTFSNIQHSQFPEILEFSGSFQPMDSEDVSKLTTLLREKVKKFDLFLVSDWE